MPRAPFTREIICEPPPETRQWKCLQTQRNRPTQRNRTQLSITIAFVIRSMPIACAIQALANFLAAEATTGALAIQMRAACLKSLVDTIACANQARACFLASQVNANGIRDSSECPLFWQLHQQRLHAQIHAPAFSCAAEPRTFAYALQAVTNCFNS